MAYASNKHMYQANSVLSQVQSELLAVNKRRKEAPNEPCLVQVHFQIVENERKGFWKSRGIRTVFLTFQTFQYKTVLYWNLHGNLLIESIGSSNLEVSTRSLERNRFLAFRYFRKAAAYGSYRSTNRTQLSRLIRQRWVIDKAKIIENFNQSFTKQSDRC